MKPDGYYALSIWTASPTPLQRRVAFATVAVLAVAFAAMAPFASVQLQEIDGFVPAVQAVIFIADLTTAGLLLSSCAADPSCPILVLASGYLFSAIVAVAYALAFPGAFTPSGLGNSAGKSTTWLFTFWIAGFCTTVLWYAWLKTRPGHFQNAIPASTRFANSRGLAISIVIALAGIVVFSIYAGDRQLPVLVLSGGSALSPLWYYIASAMLLLCAVALVLLARPPVSVLDTWLMVCVFSMILELARVTVLETKRFTLGFYCSRAFLVVVAMAVLIALLWEFGRLHGNLLRAHRMLVRERENKLTNVEAAVVAIAHQLRQPINAIVTQAAAGRRFLTRIAPEIERAGVAFDQIEKAGFHADSALEGVRALFRTGKVERQTVDLNDVVFDVLRLLSEEIETSDIKINMQLCSPPPTITGHKTQLQEVVVNLVQNAIEAMALVDRKDRILEVSTTRHGTDGVAISVADTGPGIAVDKVAEIFNPFVTTKANGMGFGLAFCKMVVEQHGGDISVAAGIGGAGAWSCCPARLRVLPTAWDEIGSG